MSKIYPKSEFHGLEISKYGLQRASEKMKEENLKNVFIHDTSNSFPKIKFDFIVLCDVLHDLSDPISIFSQLYKMLNKNGQIFTFDPYAKKTFGENLKLPKSSPGCYLFIYLFFICFLFLFLFYFFYFLFIS